METLNPVEIVDAKREDIPEDKDYAFERFMTVFDGVGTEIVNGNCTGCGGKFFFALNVATS